MGKVKPKTVLDKCAKCGACSVVCPVYNASGQECYTARGKNHLLEVYNTKKHSSSFEDIFAKCLLCGACNKACPRGLNITGKVEEIRSGFSSVYGSHGFEKYLARKVLGKPELLHGARFMGNISSKLLMKALPMESGLRLKLAMFDGDLDQLIVKSPKQFDERNDMQELVYYPGCSSTYLYPKIFDSTRRLFAKMGCRISVPDKLVCCGLAFKAAGEITTARENAKKNIDILLQTTGPILVTCGSCWAQLKNYPELFENDVTWKNKAELIVSRLAELSQFLLECLKKENMQSSMVTRKNRRVFYHDPCHLRNENNVTAEPRQVLNALPGIELVELEDGPQCCGQGGLFHLGAPKLAATIRDDLASKVLALKPEVITTSCSGCYMQWKSALAAAGSPVELLYFSELVDDSLS